MQIVLDKLPDPLNRGERCLVLLGRQAGLWEVVVPRFPSRWTGSYSGNPRWAARRNWPTPYSREIAQWFNPMYWALGAARAWWLRRRGYGNEPVFPSGYCWERSTSLRTQVRNLAAYLRG